MENKEVGYLILGISIVIIFIIALYNQALKETASGCQAIQKGYQCPAHEVVLKQAYLSYAIVGLLIIIGIVLIFSKPKEKIVVKKIIEKKNKRKINPSELTPAEKNILEIIEKEGVIFQASLIEKTGFGKSKITRILDRLEGYGLVERKRRGMTNVVVIKNLNLR